MKGSIKFKCPVCKEINTIDFDENRGTGGNCCTHYNPLEMDVKVKGY